MERLIDESGGLGKFQAMIICGVMVHKLCVGWSMMQMSYSGFIPDWHCVVDQNPTNSSHYATHSLNKCSLNNSHTGFEPKECHDFRFVGKSHTIVSEFELVCDMKWVKATTTSIQMVGVLVGAALCGQMAELVGRKKTLFGFALFHALFNIAAAFSTSWEMFAAFRFFIGIGIGGLLVVTFPYPMEFMPTKWRPLLATLPTFCIGVGMFALCAMFLENWSHLQIGCGLFGLPGLIGYIYVPESVRWLTLRGRFDEAEKVFVRMAEFNGHSPPSKIRPTLEAVYQEQLESKSQGKEYKYWDLFKGRTNAKISLVIIFHWFLMSMSFYGISFGVSALSGNLFLNIFLLQLIELPGLFSSFYLTNRLGRKPTFLLMIFVAFVGSAGCAFTLFLLSDGEQGKWITAFSLLAKMGVGTAWVCSQVWVTELYPTCVRNLGYGMMNSAARVGGIVAPFVIDLDNNQKGAYIVMASLFFAAIIFTLLLPETKGRALEDSFTTKGTNKSPKSNDLHLQTITLEKGDEIILKCGGLQNHSTVTKNNDTSKQNSNHETNGSSFPDSSKIVHKF